MHLSHSRTMASLRPRLPMDTARRRKVSGVVLRVVRLLNRTVVSNTVRPRSILPMDSSLLHKSLRLGTSIQEDTMDTDTFTWMRFARDQAETVDAREESWTRDRGLDGLLQGAHGQ